MSEKLAENGSQGEMTPLRRVLHVIATGMAGIGGLVIFGAAVFVTLSVIRANLGMGSFRGEFELVELCCAACASLFLPLCQLNNGHVMVDIFTNGLNAQTSKRIDAAWTLLFAICWALISWWLIDGLVEYYEYGDKTMMLRASLWWIFVPAVIGTAMSAIIAALMAASVFLPNLIRMEPAK